MLTEQQIKQLMPENESLRVQLNEANEILTLREEEIEILKQNAFDITELRSDMDGKLNQLQSLQNIIGQKQQEAQGAANREKELEDELIDAAKLLRQYSELKQQYTYLTTQLLDLEARLTEMNKRNAALEQKLENNNT
ncbi:MAG: hypothetical protein IPP48_05915 [Chitinophagaceae bacterium]|nr:hypothetical protein [Chitinophagaceae bacterium]